MMQTRHFRHFRHALLLVLLWTMPAWATTYWVQAGGTNSSCAAASGTTKPGAYRSSIANGIACLGGGDTLVLTTDNGSTYADRINLDNVPAGDGSFAAATIIRGESKANRPNLTGGGQGTPVGWGSCRDAWIIVKWLRAEGGPGGAYLPYDAGMGGRNTGRIRFEENLISYTGGNGFSDAADQNSEGFTAPCPTKQSHNEYLRNEVHNVGNRIAGGVSGHPIYAADGPYVLDGNHFHHCRDADGSVSNWTCYGIHLYPRANPGHVVKNNRIEFTEVGMIVVGGGHTFYNNIFANSVGSGVHNAASSMIYNSNTIVDNGGCAFYQNLGGGTAIASNNLISGNSNNTINECLDAGSITDPNGSTNISSNPNFVGGGDYHVQAGSAAINAGATLGAPYNVDLEGLTRPAGQYTAGAYQFGVSVPPEPVTPGTIAWYKANGNAQDSIGTNHGTLTNGALANGAPLVEGNSFVFDGVDDRVSVPATSALRPAAVGLSLWMKTTTPPTAVGYCHAMAMGHGWALGWGDDGKAFCWANFGPTAVMTTGTVLDGQPHMLSCAYDPAGAAPGVRLWLGNAQIAFTPYSAPLSYTGSEALSIGNSTAGVEPCAGLIDQVRLANYAWSQADIDAMFTEQVPVQGTSMTQSQWERANKPIGDVIATNADLPAYDRTQAVALAVAIQRVGTTINQYFALECSKNGSSTFTPLTNLFGTLGARIAPDSVLNMGDSVPVSLPTGGLTGVAGRVVANTINTSFTTTLDHNQQTQWRYTLDFGGPALSGDTFDCRPAGLDSYANVKRITLADPSVFLGIKGSQLKGFQFR